MSKKLGMKRPGELSQRIKLWSSNYFQEKRGRQTLDIAIRQTIYGKWLEHSITSVDCRNGREAVKIRKSIYHQKYGFQLKHTQPLVEKKKEENLIMLKRETCKYCEQFEIEVV